MNKQFKNIIVNRTKNSRGKFDNIRPKKYTRLTGQGALICSFCKTHQGLIRRFKKIIVICRKCLREKYLLLGFKRSW